MIKSTSLPWLLVLFAAAGTVSIQAGVQLNPLFSDHAVFQQGIPVPVWGTADPGSKVTVTFAGQSASATTAQDGAWRVRLGSLPANAQPGELVVSADQPKEEVKIQDILVGEVWVGSGQSNMQMPGSSFVPGLKSGDKVLATSPGDPNLKALIDGAPYPDVRLITTNTNPKVSGTLVWLPATSENLLKFSAQLQVFGLGLHQHLKVPIGLMVAAVGGTPSGQWVSASALADDAGYQKVLSAQMELFNQKPMQDKFADDLRKYEADRAAWNQLPDDQKKAQAAPQKSWSLLKPGESLPRWPIGELHDRVLSPLIGYGIRGVLWDQGEGGTALARIDQYTVMGALISSWRREWNQGDFPFIYVQKPSGGGCAFDYSDKKMYWASEPFEPLPTNVPGGGENRELYLKIASYPNTFMASTSDLGSNTHPWNKFAYGSRDAQVALGAVYGQKVEIYGPTFAGSQIEGDKIRVRFSHIGQGLTFRNGDRLQGFALAGKDKKFVWAKASVEGESVVVTSTEIPNPLYVRYAWGDKHRWANLFNQDGLPALEFRTDSDAK